LKTRRLLAAALSLPLVASAGEVWVADSTEKIRPDAKARSTTAATLGAARNEFESFQVVVTGPAHGVSATMAPLGGPSRISDVHLFRVDTVNVRQPSALDGGTGRWPDALVPDVDDVVGERRNAFPFDVAAGESRAIWVDVHVPRDASPGAYQGQVKVTSREGEATVAVKLQVWDFELPSTASLRSSFGLSWGTLRAGHGGVSGDGESALRARYGQLALDHRISLGGLADDDRAGDMGHLDQFYGPLLDGTAGTALPGAKLTALKYVGDRTSVPAHSSWASHFKDRGWMKQLFDYVCDEPPLTCGWGDINPRTQAAHAADPAFQTLVTTQIWDADAHGVTAGVDIMTPVVNWMWDKPGSSVAGDQRPRYDGFLASGSTKEIWVYQSCMSHGCGGTVNMGNPSDGDRYYTGWPSYMIDASAVRNRAMQWIDFLERATGEVYWETTMAYTHDAWSNQWDFSGNGDGTLFYPGTTARIGGSTDVPVASIRLKMIRDGMEDYEYLHAVARAGDPQFARAVALDLFPTPYQTEQDPAKLAAAREQLAQRLLALTGKPVPPAVLGAAGPIGGASGGCGSAGGATLAALAIPVLLLALRRRRRARR